MRCAVHEKFMSLAFEQANHGLGHVAPNPLVGAVIVKNGEVIASGFHRKSGEDHAEADAIKNSEVSVAGSTLYCNLEPCSHLDKKTPPCAPLIIESGISTVVISNLDPNPKVSGKGLQLLRENGIEVVTGVLEEEGLKLNEVFFHHIVNKTPFIHLKAAQTLDGKIQTTSGDSKWISSESSRKQAHLLRLKYDAVLVGRNTLNNDNPRLDIRMGVESNGKIPKRIIVGNPEKYNWDSELLKSNADKNIYIIGENTISNLGSHEKNIMNKGLVVSKKSIFKSMSDLYKAGINSILVEGGSRILSSFIEDELFNRITLFQAPKLIGNGEGIFTSENKAMSSALNLKITEVELIENNLKIELEKVCLQE